MIASAISCLTLKIVRPARVINYETQDNVGRPPRFRTDMGSKRFGFQKSSNRSRFSAAARASARIQESTDIGAGHRPYRTTFSELTLIDPLSVDSRSLGGVSWTVGLQEV